MPRGGVKPRDNWAYLPPPPRKHQLSSFQVLASIIPKIGQLCNPPAEKIVPPALHIKRVMWYNKSRKSNEKEHIMADKAPGLREIFTAISNINILRAIFEKTAPIDFDWKRTPDFADRLYEALQQYNFNNPKEDIQKFGKWCTSLYNIVSVVNHQNKKDGCDKLVGALKQLDLAQKMYDDICFGINIQTIVGWIYINADELWQVLLKESEVLDLTASKGSIYYICHFNPAHMPDFEVAKRFFPQEFIGLMKKEQTLRYNVLPEKNVIGHYHRYLMFIPPFPRNVRHADKNGGFSNRLNDIADFFTVVFSPEQNFFRISCSFTKSVTNDIAKMFAKHFLDAEICKRPPEKYALEKFNPSYHPDFKLSIPDPEIVLDARVSKIKVALMECGAENGETISQTSKTGHVFNTAQKTLEAYPLGDRRLLEVTFSVKVRQSPEKLYLQNDLIDDKYSQNVPTTTYTVKISRTNLSITNCFDVDHERAIRELCDNNGLRNIAMQKALNQLTRK